MYGELYVHHQDGKHTYLVCALVCNFNSSKESNMHSVRPLLLCVVIIWEKIEGHMLSGLQYMSNNDSMSLWKWWCDQLRL